MMQEEEKDPSYLGGWQNIQEQKETPMGVTKDDLP